MRRWLTLLALAVLIAGCGSDRRGIGTGGFVEGGTLSIYASLPRSAEPGSNDMIDGAKLALVEARGRAGEYAVNFSVLDSSAAAGRGTDPERALTNARSLLRDAQAVAVIGDVDTSALEQTLPLLNEAGILQVSPGATYAGLTTRWRAARGEPLRYEPSGDPNFVRLVPSDRVRASAYVDAAAGKRVLLEADASPAGRALAEELAGRLDVVSSRPEVVIFAGEDVETARAVFESAPAGAVLVAGDAVGRAGLASRLPASMARRLRIVTSAPDVSGTPFAASFERRFGRRASGYAAIGYETMKFILDSVARAGVAASTRQTLITYARFERRSGTLLGSYEIDGHGDTTSTAVRVAPARSSVVAAEPTPSPPPRASG